MVAVGCGCCSCCFAESEADCHSLLRRSLSEPTDTRRLFACRLVGRRLLRKGAPLPQCHRGRIINLPHQYLPSRVPVCASARFQANAWMFVSPAKS